MAPSAVHGSNMNPAIRTRMLVRVPTESGFPMCDLFLLGGGLGVLNDRGPEEAALASWGGSEQFLFAGVKGQLFVRGVAWRWLRS